MVSDFKQTAFVSIVLYNAQNELLLVRRSASDEYMGGYYDLPGGRVSPGESLEIALRRKLKQDLGIELAEQPVYQSSFAHVNAKGPYVRVIFQGLYEGGEVDVLGTTAYDDTQWASASEAQKLTLSTDAKQILEVIKSETRKHDVNKSTYLAHSDGGSRGNPGPSAAAYVIYDSAGKSIDSGGEYLGISTNNQAEYIGVLLALKALQSHADTDDSVECRIDSLLVVNQLNGVYKIKNRDLWPLHQEILALVEQFGTVRFTHVPREQNEAADSLVNQILDQHDSHS